MPSFASSLQHVCTAATLAALVAVSGAALAQQLPEVPQPSLKARVEQRVGVTDFAVEYSSPAVKGRKIWGELVPLDKPWRTGANAATRLTASREFTFGDKKVPAGSYALYTIPGKNGWIVALNTKTDAPAALAPDEKTDVARITLKPTPGPLRERLTFLFSDAADEGVNLDLEWEKLRLRIPLKVDTSAHAVASIDAAVEEAWRPHFTGARYLLDSGGDLARATQLIDASLAIKPTWWNSWVKAQILGKQGKKAEAIAAAMRAQELGKGDRVYEGFYREPIEKAVKGWK